MVFYRKYRPQNLDELIGQEHIKEVLTKAAQGGKLSHAYLFCGPRGTGKTSTARILAKIVNCSAKQTPCNKCQSCLSITDGTNLDLIEIDAASNRGIDDIRELRERIKLSPTSSKKKVYIIDEVHMLTNEAFNALLKTLEEPPAHVLFILATTDPQKLPQTILSRVQRLDFRQAGMDELITALKKAVKEEKLKVEDKALELIAKRAEGSFRDALKLLDQLASTGEDITVTLSEQLLRSGKSEDIVSLIELVAGGKTKEALELIGKNEGVNIKDFTLSLLDTLRAMLLADLGVKVDEQALRLTKLMDRSKLVRLIDSVVGSLEKLKYTPIPTLPLEIAVIESSQLSVVSHQLASRSHVRDGRSESSDKPERLGKSENQNISKLEGQKVDQQRSDESDISSSSDAPNPSDTPDLLILRDKWNYILETIRPYNYSLEALLKQVTVVSCEGGVLLLEVPYSFHQRILEAPKSRSLLESVLEDVFGKPIKVTCQLGSRPVRVEELANVEVAADDEIIKIASEIFNS